MSEPFLGEIKMIGYGNYAPKGWAYCDGALLAVSENQALYTLLGTQFGGDGRSSFGLPDMGGRTPVDADARLKYDNGTKGGVERVTLNPDQIGGHSHSFMASADGANKMNLGKKKDRLLATATENIYTGANNLQEMNSGCVTNSGGGNQPHENMQPSLVVSFIICLDGLYPPRN